MAIRQTDAAIIGAGIFGLSAAWALSTRGLKVEVYDKASVGSGASGGLVGALAPHMPEKWNPKKAFQLEALLAAERFWSDVEAASDLPTGYMRTGRALPLRSERLKNQALVRAQEVPLLWQGQAGWEVVADLAGCAQSSHGWVVETLSARLNPRKAVMALAEALRQKGVLIHENSAISDLSDLKADQIVIAAGHNARQFTPALPTEFWSAVKGQSALLDVALPEDMPMVFENGTYVVPHGGFGTAVGSTVEYDWTDPSSTDDLLNPVLEKASQLVPALKEAPIKETWAGVRPRARLPDPVMGQLENAPNIWILAGGFKIGMGVGPHMGETLSRLMLGEDPKIPPSFTLEHQLARCKAHSQG